MRVWLSLGCLLVLVAGCGGGGATSESTEAQASSGSETASSERRMAWHDMNDEQKGQFMAEVVMPEMRQLFQEHDAEEFADFSCRTCHGENAREVGFHMPNGLHPLSHDQIMATFASDHPGAVFMTQRVWPRMAELLGEPLYNPETQQGFSCLNCHGSAEGGESSHH